jgi:nucleolar protein 58
MARMVATKTALSVRVDALTDADEKSTPTAPTIGLENRARLEARLRSLEAESDASGVRRFAVGPNQQKRVKLGPAAPTYNPAADAVGLLSTQREPMEAVKAVMDVKEEKQRAKEERRAKRRAEKEKAAAEEEERKPNAVAADGEADAMDVDGEEKLDEKKRKRRKSEVTSLVAADNGAVTAMVRYHLFFFLVVKQPGMLTIRAREVLRQRLSAKCGSWRRKRKRLL